MKKSPMQRAADRGGKAKLLDEVVDVIERGDESKEEIKARLKGAANTKLLRLLAVGTRVKQEFGSKDKLVDALLALENRGKDGDYRTKLSGWTAARLLDRHDTAVRRKAGSAGSKKKTQAA